MKYWIAGAALSLSLSLPVIAEARDHHGWHQERHQDQGRDDGRGDGRGYGHWRRDDDGREFVHGIGHVIAFPFVVGAAVIGAAATVVAAPFYAIAHEGPYERGYDGRYADDEQRPDPRDYAAPAYEGEAYDAPIGHVYGDEDARPVYRGYGY